MSVNKKDYNASATQPRTYIKPDMSAFERTFAGEDYDRLTVEQARELLSSKMKGRSLADYVKEEREES